jgi:glutathione S-transferase
VSLTEFLMKLYYSPGACSLSPHIVLNEAGLPYELVRVDLKTKLMENGDDFRRVNPKGYVPVIRLDNGEILTEGPAIVQYLADLRPETRLAPPPGTMERYRLQEWLNFISTELHKQFGPLFNPQTPEEMREAQKKRLGERFDFVVTSLDGHDYLMPQGFTVADAYLYTVLTWAPAVGLSLDAWPALRAYMDRVQKRPGVAAALAKEREAKKGS